MSAPDSKTAAPADDDDKDVYVKSVEFPQLTTAAGPIPESPLATLENVPLTIAARLGHVVLPIGEVLKLGPGAVVELEESIHHPVELTVRGVPFAVGEVVVVNDRFAVQIKSLLTPQSGNVVT